MNTENMKNMLVLKDLPSNIVDEAIVILKPNVKLKSLDVSQNNNIKNKKTKTENPKKYIINEAEMLISNYISKIENDKNIKVNKRIEDKCKKLRITSIVLGIAFLASVFVWWVVIYMSLEFGVWNLEIWGKDYEGLLYISNYKNPIINYKF